MKAWAASREQSGEVERVTKKQVHQEANSSARGLKARFLDDPAVSQVRNPSGGQSKIFENCLSMLAQVWRRASDKRAILIGNVTCLHDL
jgi:hypothetical protein